MKNRVAKRILSFTLVIMTLIALVLSLSACSGGNPELDPQTKEETGADFVARALSTDYDLRIRFLAASRGYDITSEDFEDKSEDLGVNVGFAKKVLEDVLENIEFDSTADKTTFEEYKNALTEESVKAVIASDNFKEEYDLDTSAGFPTILLVWIGKFLGLITNIVGDYYVLAIFIFAIIVELLMLPMAVKQQKNSIGMAKLRPAIARIEKKYAGRTDQVTMRKKQEEIMELQQKAGYSPFSGCLPLIIQLVIVGFILYPIIQNPLRYVLNESTDFSNALMTYATAPEAAGGLGLDIRAGNVMELLSSLNAENMKGLADFALVKAEDASTIIAEYATVLEEFESSYSFEKVVKYTDSAEIRNDETVTFTTPSALPESSNIAVSDPIPSLLTAAPLSIVVPDFHLSETVGSLTLSAEAPKPSIGKSGTSEQHIHNRIHISRLVISNFRFIFIYLNHRTFHSASVPRMYSFLTEIS